MSPLKSLSLCILLVSLGSLMFAEAPDWSWAIKAGGTGTDGGKSVVVDAIGNSFVTGSFTGTATFGSYTVTSTTIQVYVAKLSYTGDWLWAVQAGGAGVDDGLSIAVSNSGEVYVTGSYQSPTATFGSISLTRFPNSSSSDAFIAKLSPTGTWLWAKKLSGFGIDLGQSISLDSSSNVYVTGAFKNTLTIETSPTTTLTASGYTDIVVAKLSSSGNWLWAKKAGGAGTDYGFGIDIDGSGNVYVGGSFTGVATFGTVVINAGSTSDGFVSKLDTNGNWLWTKSAGGAGSELTYSIAVDVNNSVYIAGSFNALAYFGTISLSCSGNFDGFIAKLDENGNWLWAQKAAGTGIDQAWYVAVDNNLNSYVVGEFLGTASFGTINLSSNGSGYSDGYLAQLSPDGTWQWAKKMGGTSTDATNSVAVDLSGNVYVCGDFMVSIVFGTTTLTTTGGQDLFVAKAGNNTLSLLSPVGGENWVSGSTHAVNWAAMGVESVLLDYSLNAGTDWMQITETPISANLGTFNWVLPDTVCTNALVRVRDAANENNYSISNSTFSIYVPLILNSPNGGVGVAYASGSTQQISWTAMVVSQVYLDYTLNAGNTWMPIVTAPIAASLGTYDWVIPNVSSDYVRVRIRDAENSSIFVESSSVFSIYNPLTLVSPNGGAGVSYLANSTLPVTWTAIGLNTVLLDYSLDAGTTWIPISETPVSAGLGTFDWLLPDLNCQDTKVRVRDTSNPAINAISENVFAILKPLTLQSPQGGAEVAYAVNTVLPIVWTSIGVQQVMLDYSLDSGTNWIPVVANPLDASLGYYDWLLPNSISNAVKVRISDYTTPAINSVSNGLFSIYIPLVLHSPNGGVGVAYPANSQQTISWTATFISQVLLDYTIDAGNTWTPIITAPIPASPGSYNWTIPNLSSDLVRVRVRDAADPDINAESESVFSIYFPLILNSPNGGAGESYLANTILPVTWAAIGINTVLLDYSLNSGTDWLPIADIPVAANLETYDWLLPSVSSNNVKVRVRDASNSEIFAVSSSVFSINIPLTLLSPQGGEDVSYAASTELDIEWTSFGVEQVMLDYSLDSGTTWIPIVANPLAASLESYEWLIPELTSTQVKIRISDYTTPAIFATSNGLFSIYIPLVLHSPNGGVGIAYPCNSQLEITWTAVDIDDVFLDYSLDAGSSWNPILSEPISADLGSYMWVLPIISSTQAKVRIRDAEEGEFIAVSASVFSIYIPLVLVSPNGGSGETYVAYTTLPITWTAINVPSVFLDYSLNGGIDWTLINPNPVDASIGSYDWTLPGVTCYDVKVRVRDSADPDIAAISSNVFAIRLPLTLLSLQGGLGVNYPALSTQSIQWTAYSVTQILLDYSIDAGTTWLPIISEPLSASSEEYDWVLPNLTEHNVRVRIRDYSNFATFVQSDADFAIIIPPSIPEDVLVELDPTSPSNFQIGWNAVLTDVNGTPIQATGYKIYYSSTMSDDLADYTLLATVTDGTSFIHEGATQSLGKVFYRIVAFRD